MIGKTLAHYEVLELIGKGGMGEVYRARDAKLGRDVALKILPRELSGDPERAARFEREARTLATLQHPNIASIYGYEQADGLRFLSMELVAGEDLAQRLQRGALSIDETVRVARQIAVGLEAAHDKNIVHRDLKPANIKIDNEGTVKILDFGLARAFVGDNEEGAPENSPTITSARTMAGVILGTAAYMSPEQARGKPIDKRSDIWSFGVIVFEMLTGRQMYSGETVTDVLGAIVHSTPDLGALPQDVPPRLRELLQRCLSTDAHDRLRDIGEARYALHHLQGGPIVAPRAGASARGWKVAAAVLVLVSLVLTVFLLASPDPQQSILQASITLPPDHYLVTTGGLGGSIRLSPDGSNLAFVVQEPDRRRIWVRELGERVARPVPGTESGQRPFWSPDGQSIAFFQEGKLRRISVQGGATLTIANAPDGRGGTWFPDGTIIFTPNPGTTLSSVPAGGGQPRVVSDPRYNDREPRRLPDGEHFLHLESRGGGKWRILVSNLDGSDVVEVGPTSGGVEYSNGRLLYLQGRTLVAQPFDLDTFQLTGEPTPLAENIIRDINYGIGVFSASGNVLAYQAGANAGSRLNWTDTTGRILETLGEQVPYDQISLSPDGRTLAVVINDLDGRSDIWMLDVERGTTQRLTFTPDDEPVRRNELVWAPDGKRLYYSLESEDHSRIFWKQTNGSGDEHLLAEGDENLWPYDITPDGTGLLVGMEDSTSSEDLVLVSVETGTIEPLYESPFDSWPGQFSPDARWIAFDADDSGQREIYVIPFRGGSGKWQISKSGGRYPRWSHDGRKIFYVSPDADMMAVDVDPTGESFSAGEPEALFHTELGMSYFGSYDVDPTGQRFLLLQSPQQEAPISLFVNWVSALEKR